jgi:ABC-2 type transport system ATP-binding protein
MDVMPSPSNHSNHPVSLSLSNGGKQYAGDWVFRHVSLCASGGSCLAIVGSNGCGKTTLLETILGIRTLDEGEVATHETARIGFSFGSSMLYHRLSVETNLKLYCALAGIDRKDRKDRIAHGLTQSELENARKMDVAKISSGMKRRLSLAIAQLTDPNILLLDEPFNELDQHHQERLQENLANLIRRGALTVVCSHNRDLLAPLDPHWFLLDGGRLSPIDIDSVDFPQEPPTATKN